MNYLHICLLVATIVANCVSTPVPNVTSSLPPSATPGKGNNTKLRQDEGDVDEAVAGFETVAGPIGQIITGTLSGNIGQLFSGITGTVTDEAAQPGVGEILTGVSLPLSTLWQNGIAAGTKYFNITTESPLGAKNNATQQAQLNGAVQPNANPQQPLLNNQQQVVTISQEQLLALQQQNQVQPQVVNEAPATAAAAAVAPVPVAVETTTQLLEDDDDEDESELRRNNIHKV